MLLIFPDIMDAEHCDRLIHEHDSNPSKQISAAADASFDGRVLLLQNMREDVRHLASSITLQIGSVIGRHFETDLYPETVSTVSWSAGQMMLAHRDGQRPETIHRSHSVVVYLNDQPEGGAIYFPEIGTTIQPRRALMVAYAKNLLHGVTPVSRTRYTLTLWYTTERNLSVIQTI